MKRGAGLADVKGALERIGTTMETSRVIRVATAGLGAVRAVTARIEIVGGVGTVGAIVGLTLMVVEIVVGHCIIYRRARYGSF